MKAAQEGVRDMTAKDDFLRELSANGVASKETQKRLAEELRAKPRTGRPRKTLRGLEVSAWYLIAIEPDGEGMKKGITFDRLAERLKTDSRQARRVWIQAAETYHLCILSKYEDGSYSAAVVVKKLSEMCSVSAVFNGQLHTTFDLQQLREGKDVHFFLFDKSDF